MKSSNIVLESVYIRSVTVAGRHLTLVEHVDYNVLVAVTGEQYAVGVEFDYDSWCGRIICAWFIHRANSRASADAAVSSSSSLLERTGNPRSLSRLVMVSATVRPCAGSGVSPRSARIAFS